jgi:hypothetical protein
VPHSLGGWEGKTTKVKFKIPEELGAKPETRKGGKRKLLRSWLTKWLVRTLLLVSAESILTGRQAEYAVPGELILWQVLSAM